MQKVGKEDWLHCYPSKVDRASWILLWEEKGPLLLPIGRFSTLVFVRPIDKYYATKPPWKSNPHETKPNQNKISFWKKMFWFGKKSKDKWVFFLLHILLSTRHKMISVCLSLLQPLLSAFPTKQRFPTVFSRVLK